MASTSSAMLGTPSTPVSLQNPELLIQHIQMWEVSIIKLPQPLSENNWIMCHEHMLRLSAVCNIYLVKSHIQIYLLTPLVIATGVTTTRTHATYLVSMSMKAHLFILNASLPLMTCGKVCSMFMRLKVIRPLSQSFKIYFILPLLTRIISWITLSLSRSIGSVLILWTTTISRSQTFSLR
jgi:hypothetical protein